MFLGDGVNELCVMKKITLKCIGEVFANLLLKKLLGYWSLMKTGFMVVPITTKGIYCQPINSGYKYLIGEVNMIQGHHLKAIFSENFDCGHGRGANINMRG